MLNAQITRQANGSLSCAVYRKPTHTDQYLNFGSHHPLQHNMTLIYKGNNIITREKDLFYHNFCQTLVKGSVAISYIQGVSQTVACVRNFVFQSKGIRTTNPSTPIRQQLALFDSRLQKTGLRWNRNRALYTISRVTIAPLLMLVNRKERFYNLPR